MSKTELDDESMYLIVMYATFRLYWIASDCCQGDTLSAISNNPLQPLALIEEA